jgi:predicted N-acetyltransferase YhbS
METSTKPLVIRRAQPGDAEACGQICYEAFTTLNQKFNFPPDFPNPEAAKRVLSFVFSNPGFFCVVAEQDGRILGSNCMDERCSIAGVGPITVDTASQNGTVGRQLMQAVLDRAGERHFAGVRLIQAAFHGRSMALYTKLGFAIREPIVVMNGAAIHDVPPTHVFRVAVISDLDACNGLCRRVHGHDRSGELADDIAEGTARVLERDGRITSYGSDIGFFGHAVAESNYELQALLAGADGFAGPGILVPTRNTELFSWCLNHGLRVVEPMSLMTMGLYNEPAGAFLPSILY